MRVTVLLAIAFTVAFATAALAEPEHNHGAAAGTSNSTITNPTGGVGTGALPGTPDSTPIGGEPGSPYFDPLAQTLGNSSTALLEVELQRLMRTW